jgi:hypothetical protein
MKRFFTILIVLSTSTGLLATGLGNPNLKLTHDTVYLKGDASQSTVQNVNHITNIGSSSIDLKWEVIENTSPSAWELGFCDKENCYTLDGTVHSFSLPAGDSSMMDLLVYPKNTTGTATVKIAVYPATGTIGDGVIITHYVNIKPVSINSAAAVNFTMYPNPVKDNLNINFSRKGNHHIEIYNILGNKILVKDVFNVDYLRVPFSGYQRGRYIVMYRSDNGKVITKSITKE